MGADGIEYQSFENQLNRNILNISRKVCSGKYTFYPCREIDVDKDPISKPGAKRNLSISTIRDSLIQNILYEEFLYEQIEEIFKTLDYPAVVSFAYRKGKSAPKAAQVVFKYVNQGYEYFFDADLSKYFDNIPHKRLMRKVQEVFGESEPMIIQLIYRFIKTDKVLFSSYVNAHLNGKYFGKKIFHIKKPRRIPRVKGVPQGGRLSGLLANLYLHDFDKWVLKTLSKDIDLKYVRYADDFIILVKTKKDLEICYKKTKEILNSLELSLSEDKCIKKHISNQRISFVGFDIDHKNIRVREKNVNKYQRRINDIIDSFSLEKNVNDPHILLRKVIKRINYKVAGFSGEEICPWCCSKKRGLPRSWMSFFKIVTDVDQLRDLDNWTRTQIYNFFFKKYNMRVSRADLRKAGLQSLVKGKYKSNHSKIKPCLCDIEKNGIWFYAKQLFQGKSFTTLARRKSFLVRKVDNCKIIVDINKRIYEIKRQDLEKIWDELIIKKSLSRSQLEISGYKNTSQIVALLNELPAVENSINPIRLYFLEKRVAHFLE